jgi:hypothetical protein
MTRRRVASAKVRGHSCDVEQEEFVDDSVDRRPVEPDVETCGRHVAAPAGTPRPVEGERVSSLDDA